MGPLTCWLPGSPSEEMPGDRSPDPGGKRSPRLGTPQAQPQPQPTNPRDQMLRRRGLPAPARQARAPHRAPGRRNAPPSSRDSGPVAPASSGRRHRRHNRFTRSDARSASWGPPSSRPRDRPDGTNAARGGDPAKGSQEGQRPGSLSRHQCHSSHYYIGSRPATFLRERNWQRRPFSGKDSLRPPLPRLH
ncbi:proline-rich protein HaeIII subfamily 1-like [Lemur catta]|uniref:proline-rich protein HaeIII subfamily 1-like n=1 Tax=Lemur catta TaxID=9447 RepID=UPI001E2670D9|nr:proline-rich protein HaeIII subfamily 1-like [Lemur catta]